ncbi:MAG TPA: DUF3307 domain-containing protein [Cytophagales bacterium]|nr:DUF3307 domain-containing protein [Cytophagales bacterium]
MIILLKLIIAHIITDFVAQPNKWVKDKKEKRYKSIYLYLHVMLTGAVTYFILGDPYQWQVPLFIAITHFIIDLWKLHKEDNLIYFLVDQIFHLIVLGIAWLYLSKGFEEVMPVFFEVLNNESTLSLIIAYLIIIWPAGYVIGKATVKWRIEIEALTPERDSLNEAGKWIGIFERLLVMTFVLTDQFSAIGFLIAAKSILRFGDKSSAIQRKQTEYVLVGTLMSFTFAIFLGIITRLIISYYKAYGL